MWPFKRKEPVDTREITWLSFFDRYDDDPFENRHRERMTWLNENVGPGNFKHSSEDDDLSPGLGRIYGFYDKNHAMMFKLVWGGQ